jgi:cellulose synthase/poly-beta-1,6-N-acetylglucosamine synthase-like glycosyltransferase
MTGVGDILVPLVAIGFTGFHIAFGRWLLAGLRRAAPRLSTDLPPATILVPARDEEANLRHLLPALLAQDYPKDRLQILVVDDRSTDGTAEIVQASGGGVVELVAVGDLPAGIGPKKNAILRGLERATGEIVLQLDADNTPQPGWARAMVGSFGPRTGAVCGLVFHAERFPGVKAWFHGTWAVEALGWAAVQEAAIGNGVPISANGGNLAYRRKAFESVGGFGRHGHVVSGDDDFLIQALADSGRWDVVSAGAPQTQVTTRGPSGWSVVWEQRKRWGSICVRYDAKRVALLSAVYASYAWIAILLPLSLLDPRLLAWAVLPLLAILWEAWVLVESLAGRTGRRRFLVWFPLAALLQIPLVLVATAAGTFGRFRWKDGWTRASRARAD